MGQAEELLNSLVNGEEVVTGDYIIIGNDRFLSVPEPMKKLGVQFDKDIETVTFDCPRYWDDHDMSKMSIYVNYMRPDEYMDSAPCANVIVSPDDETRIRFDWTISRNVTEINGNLTVLICIKNGDEAGYEQNHWNSELCHDFYISEGMEVNESTIAQYPDIVEHLLLRMATIENKTTQAAMLNYVKTYLEKDPSVVIEKIEDVVAGYPVQQYVEDYLADYVDIRTTENRILEGSYASAYEMVEMHGKSEQPRYEGYQLYDASKNTSHTANGASVTNNNDGSLTVSGSGVLTGGGFGLSRTYTHEETVELLKAGTITLKTETTTYPYFYAYIGGSAGGLEVNNQYLTSVSKEISQELLDDEATIMRVGFYGSVDEIIKAGTITPMLYQDGDGTWEPFTGCKSSPSYEYEQEIKSVNKELTIRTTGKNFFGGLRFAELLVESGATASIDESIKTVEITANVNTKKFSYSNFKENTQYTFFVKGYNRDTNYVNVTNLRIVYTDGTDGFLSFNTDGSHTVIVSSAGKSIAHLMGIFAASYSVFEYEYFGIMEGVCTLDDFEKYQESTADITLSDNLRGINNICDIICKKKSRWGVERHWGSAILDAADFNEITWAEYENVTFFTLPKPVDSLVNGKYLTVDALCTKFRCDTVHPLDQLSAVGNINTAASAPLLWFGFPKGTTLEETKSAGMFVYVYQLAEPVWEEFDDESQLALDNLQVFDGVTYVFIEGTSVQSTVISRYGTSNWGARAINNTNRIEKLEENTYSKEEVNSMLGDINSVLESLIG